MGILSKQLKVQTLADIEKIVQLQGAEMIRLWEDEVGDFMSVDPLNWKLLKEQKICLTLLNILTSLC
jgi:hypothetical protein